MFFIKRPFGLNISDFSIELILLSGTFENPRLLAMGRKELPSGIVENGKIKDKEKLKNFLKEVILKPEFGKINSKRFIFSISELKSFIHSCKKPDSENILEFVKGKIKENFPFPLKELSFDFKIENENILIVALPKEIIQDYLEVFSECKIFPLVLETESLSLGRALISDRKVSLISDIGSKYSHFSLFDEKKLKLSVSLPIAGNTFTLSISKNLKISFNKAEKLKKEIGLNPEEKEGRVFLALQKEIQKLIAQIREIEDFYFKRSSKRIEKIILTGGSANLPYLKEYLKENLKKEILIGDPWEKIDINILRKKEYLKKALKINPYIYSAAIGSALRGLEKNFKESGINLLKEIK